MPFWGQPCHFGHLNNEDQAVICELQDELRSLPCTRFVGTRSLLNIGHGCLKRPICHHAPIKQPEAPLSPVRHASHLQNNVQRDYDTTLHEFMPSSGPFCFWPLVRTNTAHSPHAPRFSQMYLQPGGCNR